ncbi:hypothetical protein GPECTOR_196g336 [Gonium pectorale]|uniref:Uncharacterized protein n=1 Tax=Gonium pectorale TaxID=33097 RepID=A0A150FWZ4_GONPE|nr:hypothetical protein GPECTOR_196g336 [Gonium pectorale]|eukprot:KXZ42144.1 hypothetical protein GPECTOR_196g336 [Gonium pectorale]
MFARPSLGPLATLRGSSVVAWADARAGPVQHLLLDFGSASHDFSGHALESLLRAANRGPRGLRTLRLMGAAVGQDSYEMLARLKGLAELHVSGLPQGFLAGTLPFLASLSSLTRLSFTPEAFQFAVAVPALPINLQSLTLSQLWLSKLPSLASSAPRLRELELLRCYLVDGALTALNGLAALTRLRLDGSSLTTHTGGRMGWEAGAQWPAPGACPGLLELTLAGCSLRELPAAALVRFAPDLQLLDLSGNPDLGGASTVPDAAAGAASVACLPHELSQLTSLSEVRLAGCGLTALPTALLRCPALTALDLSSNSLSALPLPLVPLRPNPATAYLASRPAAALVRPGSAAAMALAAGARAAQGAAATPGLEAAFAEQLVRLNIATNRFTLWPQARTRPRAPPRTDPGTQGLTACRNLRELVLGAPLLARAAEGDLERCVAALPGLARLEVRGVNFEPRAVRSLLAVQRLAGARGRPVVDVQGL